MQPQHPLYGPYQPGWRECAGFPDYEINEYSQIRNIKTQKLFQGKDTVGLTKNGKRYFLRCYKLCLLSFFPHVTPKATVDHIDECWKNHFVENLQYLSFGENTAKSNRLRKRSHEKFCKPVIQLTSQGHVIQKFASSAAAANATGISRTNIRRACIAPHRTAGLYRWKFADADWQKDLPGEIWATNEKLKNMLQSKGVNTTTLVSNMGRIQTYNGMKTAGAKMSRQRKYRTFGPFVVHQLVWITFGHRQPQKGEFILHDDQQPLDADGCYSNAIAHLRLGTQSENMKESHKVGALSKKSQKRTFSALSEE